MKKFTVIINILIFSLCLFFAGCTAKLNKTDASYHDGASRITSFRDVPGITKEEIKAIETFQEQNISFVYGVAPSTEAFYDTNGEIRGFTVYFCEWLTELFGLQFNAELFDWDEVLSGLESGGIDFTGELTSTPKRRETYIMTDAIAARFLKYFRIAGSESLENTAMLRPLRYGFFSGTITYDDVFKEKSTLPDGSNFIPFFADNYDEAYDLLISGKIDAFIDEHTSEAAFESFGNIIAEDLFPLIYSSVSLATQKSENAPIISVMQKILQSGGIYRLVEMYNTGEIEYKKHKFFTQLTEKEQEYLRNNPTVKFAAEHDNYPISFYNIHDKEFQGISHDVLKEIEKLTGLSFQIFNNHNDDWNVILKMLEDGEVSVISELIRTPEREGHFLWPKTPVLTDHYAFLSKEEYRNTKINEIMYTKIGLIDGYAQTEFFNKWFPEHANSVTYDNFIQAFNALERNEIDMVMGSNIMLLVMTNFYELPGYKANLVLDYPYPSTFGINKNEKVLCSIIDKALMVIDTANIENQWTSKTYDYRIRISKAQLTAILSIICAAILVLFLSLFVTYRSKQFAKIQEESESKSIFLANMSHEIRTPMNAITGMAEMLLRGELSSEMRCYAQDIKHAGNNLISIINDILDISKIEAGKLEIIPVNYTLSSLVNDTVNIIRTRLAEKLIWFETNVEETIPNNLIGDEVRVRQIILNLLSNAVKYTEKGGISFNISIEEINADKVWLKIAVTDTGKGIRPEDQTKLFNNFVQVDKKKNKGIEGTGLGLAITKRLVDAMGGNISLESEYGKGSTFTVIVPQDIASPEPFGTLEIIEPNYNGSTLEVKHTFPEARILVVDDLPVNLKVAEGLLAPYNAKIDTCTSGEEAIEFVKQNKYDIVFMDHMMPGMDGIETTMHIREFNTQLPIIALTANAVVGMKEKFIENGFNDFISKPIDVSKLDEMLERWIGNTAVKEQTDVSNGTKTAGVLKNAVEIRGSALNNKKATLLPYEPEHDLPAKAITYVGKKFLIFSCIFFIIIALTSSIAYSLTARQINRNQIEQQLAIAGETIRLRLASTVNSELSLVLKMADTPVIKQYFINPYDPYLKALAEEEIDIYKQHFKDKIAFWVSDVDRIFYSSTSDPYNIDPDDEDSYWYNMTLYETEKYNFNINYNANMNMINLWVNVPVFADTEDGTRKPIGMLGTGIDLTEFAEFVSSGYRNLEYGITPYIFNKFNEITSSLDYDLVFNKIRIDDHLGEAGKELINAANKLYGDDSISFSYDGNLYQISAISEMEWYLVAIHSESGLLALNDTMNMVFFGMLFLIFIMFIVINIFIYRSENAIADQNKQLIESNRKAQAASRAKSDFLGKISHEIRTPINAILGMNELILRSNVPDEVQDYAIDIKRAGASLISIINEILDFSETDVNKLDDIFIKRGISHNGKTPAPAAPSSAAASTPIPNPVAARPAAPAQPRFPIPGVDTEKGISMTGRTVEKYKMVLVVLCENIEERLALLETVPDNDNLPIFITQVHALKSSLATIGAQIVSEQAAALEKAGNDADMAFIEQKLPVFTKDLTELLGNIRAALENNNTLPKDNAGTDNAGTDNAAYPLLSELASVLKTQDAFEADRIIEEINAQKPDSSVRKIIEEVSGALLTADFDKAAEILENYLNRGKS